MTETQTQRYFVVATGTVQGGTVLYGYNSYKPADCKGYVEATSFEDAAFKGARMLSATFDSIAVFKDANAYYDTISPLFTWRYVK